MKSDWTFCGLIFLLLATSVRGQGTFIYDQQSSDESYVAGDASIQADQPGQSFTPTLPAVEFIRLFLQDGFSGNSLGATLYLNLRSNSITGPLIGVTAPVFMPDGFIGFTNFFFSTAVTLTPGLSYFFQPVVQSGDFWHTAAYNAYNYAGGIEFLGTTPFPNNDLWFREGIVPEPSSLALAVAGITAFTWARRLCRRRQIPGYEREV